MVNSKLSIHEFHGDYSVPGSCFALILEENSGSNGSLVCLASTVEFVGNCRFLLGHYWVYPSIQASVWSISLDPKPTFEVQITGRDFSSLIAWPALDKVSRLEFARELNLDYYSANNVSKLPAKFESVLDGFIDVSKDYVLPAFSEPFISIEEYAKLWSNNPDELLLGEINSDVAIAVGERLPRQLADFKQGVFDADRQRLHLRKIAEVKMKQKPVTLPKGDFPDLVETYLKGALSLGLSRLVIPVPGNDVRRFTVNTNNQKLSLYLEGERVRS